MHQLFLGWIGNFIVLTWAFVEWSSALYSLKRYFSKPIVLNNVWLDRLHSVATMVSAFPAIRLRHSLLILHIVHTMTLKNWKIAFLFTSNQCLKTNHASSHLRKPVQPTWGNVAGNGSQVERAITPASVRDAVNPGEERERWRRITKNRLVLPAWRAIAPPLKDRIDCMRPWSVNCNSLRKSSDYLKRTELISIST